jgi:hypothetical protein
VFDADLPWDEADAGYAAMRWQVDASWYSIQWIDSSELYVFHAWNRLNYEARAETNNLLVVRAWLYEYKHPSTRGGK